MFSIVVSGFNVATRGKTTINVWFLGYFLPNTTLFNDFVLGSRCRYHTFTMKVAYIRVSSSGQSLEVQRDAVTKANATKIFEEKVSGTSTQGRVRLRECLDFVREGDELVITRIDRLARSVLDLQLIIKELTEKGVSLTATEQPISTKDATSKCFLDMLGVFAELETNLRKERQMEGIAKAKEKGVYKGGKAKIDVEQIKKLKEEGMGATAIGRQLKIDRTSVYRLLKKV